MLRYFSIYRPLNILFIALAQFLCAYFIDFNADFDSIKEGVILWVIIGTAFCLAFGYWINDFLDRDRDSLNKTNPSYIKSLSNPIVYIHLAVFILISSTGISLNIHFCGNEIFDYSVFGKPKICKSGKIAHIDDANLRVTKPSCCSHSNYKIETSDDIIYGINTGFGSLCNTIIPKENLTQLQVNLIQSHACGMGNLCSDEVVKMMLALKVLSLTNVSNTSVFCIRLYSPLFIYIRF